MKIKVVFFISISLLIAFCLGCFVMKRHLDNNLVECMLLTGEINVDEKKQYSSEEITYLIDQLEFIQNPIKYSQTEAAIPYFLIICIRLGFDEVFVAPNIREQQIHYILKHLHDASNKDFGRNVDQWRKWQK